MQARYIGLQTHLNPARFVSLIEPIPESGVSTWEVHKLNTSTFYGSPLDCDWFLWVWPPLNDEGARTLAAVRIPSGCIAANLSCCNSSHKKLTIFATTLPRMGSVYMVEIWSMNQPSNHEGDSRFSSSTMKLLLSLIASNITIRY